ncbi:tetratricopeptide repeat protein [Pseudoduganella sp. LjRoot289]|uniref:tetratricopeptide repeat protein n=1 Tax=Pseudoduganella sp. LjRoot289 TaxID=3342314 RepID=UPI003ECDDC1B
MSASQSDTQLLASGHAAREAGLWQQALGHYLPLAARRAEAIDAWVGMALCHEQLGDIGAARAALETALAKRPGTAFVHHRLGWLSLQADQFEQALPHFVRAVECAPNWYEPQYAAAVCHQKLRRYSQAIACYERALTLKKDYAPIWYHAAKALKDSGQLEAARPCYAKALELDPGYADARYSLGLLDLLCGDWLSGWAGYELRSAGSDRAGREHATHTGLAFWRGEAVPAGSAVVVYAEQGMGDAIMCFRFAAKLREVFARVKFVETAPLTGLFQRSAPAGVEVAVRTSEAIDEAGYTHYLYNMSLPAVFKASPATVAAAPYLQPDPERVRAWRQRLAGDARLKVGLVWSGGQVSHAPGRNMPFAKLAPLLALPGVHWVSLQKDEAAPAGAPVSDWMAECADMGDTAALVAALDLVIAVDTSVAHLAGAMGKPIWLLSRFESEWRWMYRQSNTPWYPSMHVFQQNTPDDWAGLIAQVQARILYNFAPEPSPCQTSAMKTFLHVGCGPKHNDRTTRGFNTPEWKELRFDIDQKVKPDIVGTMTDMAAVEDGMVDAIFSSHNIECLYPHEVPVALKEFLRVLKDDGFLVVTCPDLQSVCELVAEGKLVEPVYESGAGPISPLDILYGHRPAMACGNLYMAHRCGFTEKVLSSTLHECGFKVVITMRRKHPCYDLYAVASKGPFTEEAIRVLAQAHFPS